ncbi:MAG: cation:proton antiporter, partial [Phycisphaerales bacterium]
MDDASVQSLAFAFGAGALVSVVSSRLRIPAVLPLMVVGIVLGPSAVGLVEFSSVGDLFRVIVSLSIGLLVFEGGLHLDREELSRAPRAVLGMLSTGAAV